VKYLIWPALLLIPTAGFCQEVPKPSVQADSSGACSPNIIANEGRVQITCNTAIDQETLKKVLSILNQVLRKQNDSSVTNQKLDQILALLRPQPSIERTVKFAILIPFDSAPDSFPIPLDENPDDPLFRTYGDLRFLAMNGTVPQTSSGAKSEGQIQVQGRPISMDEAPSFLGKLLQYYVFHCIDSLQRNSLTVSVGYPAEASAGIEPPNAEPYPYDLLSGELGDNAFFRPFQNRPSADEMAWKLKPVSMPKGTIIKFLQTSNPDKYVVRLQRLHYFKVDFIVDSFVGTGLGQVPKHFVTQRASTTMEWTFFVTMRYTIDRPDDENFNPGSYAQWLDALYDKLRGRLVLIDGHDS
jgi:hypothetical protein